MAYLIAVPLRLHTGAAGQIFTCLKLTKINHMLPIIILKLEIVAAEMSAGFMVEICHDGEGAWVGIDWRLCKAPRLFENLALRNRTIHMKQVLKVMDEQVEETERVIDHADGTS